VDARIDARDLCARGDCGEEILATHEGFGDRYRAALAQCALATFARRQSNYGVSRTYVVRLVATVQQLKQPPPLSTVLVL
jgi:hypothetical protein